MAESIFMKVSEVAKELGVSESYAYKLVRNLNKELEETGCTFIHSGCKVPWALRGESGSAASAEALTGNMWLAV